MIKRLGFGVLLGCLVGSIVAAVITQALGLTFVGTAGAFFAYACAAVVGVLTGLVAGKPIWSQTGKIEAGLKAFFGALIAAGVMFVVRKWVPLTLDLSNLNSGSGPIGDLPIVALPAIAGLLGAFFEADNTPDEDGDAKASGAKPAAKVRVEASKGKKVQPALEDELDDGEAGSTPAKKRR